MSNTNSDRLGEESRLFRDHQLLQSQIWGSLRGGRFKLTHECHLGVKSTHLTCLLLLVVRNRKLFFFLEFSGKTPPSTHTQTCFNYMKVICDSLMVLMKVSHMEVEVAPLQWVRQTKRTQVLDSACKYLGKEQLWRLRAFVSSSSGVVVASV